MSRSYRQKIVAQAQVSQLLSIEEEKNQREKNRRMCLTAFECYSEGWERGIEDERDNYTGALNRISTLGEDYAYPQSYRNGYTAAWGR